MTEYPAAKLRNFALIGHGGTGKTSLAEAMLFTAGAITRLGRVEDLRKWSTPLVIGGPGVALYVASKLRIRRSLRGVARSIFRKPSV